MAISGTRVASGGADQAVHIWDMSTASQLAVYKGHRGAINALAWISDTLLASASDDGSVRVWNTQDGVAQIVYSGHKGPVLALAAINAGSVIVSGGADTTAQVWNALNGKRYGVYSEHKGPIRSLAIASPTPATPTFATTTPRTSGSSPSWLVASASEDKTVRIWPLDGYIQQE